MRNTFVLVTGAAGFIGARFVESCYAKGLAVISVDKRAHFTSRAEHRGLKFGQIVDRQKLFEWLEKEKPPLSAIIHLGACTDTTELNRDCLSEVNLDYSKK